MLPGRVHTEQGPTCDPPLMHARETGTPHLACRFVTIPRLANYPGEGCYDYPLSATLPCLLVCWAGHNVCGSVGSLGPSRLRAHRAHWPSALPITPQQRGVGPRPPPPLADLRCCGSDQGAAGSSLARLTLLLTPSRHESDGVRVTRFSAGKHAVNGVRSEDVRPGRAQLGGLFGSCWSLGQQ